MDLGLNNPQRLICHKTQPTNQRRLHPVRNGQTPSSKKFGRPVYDIKKHPVKSSSGALRIIEPLLHCHMNIDRYRLFSYGHFYS